MHPSQANAGRLGSGLSVAELLADCGYRVKGFSDPESAVEFAVDQKFTLGIFDFRLGSVKSGLDVIETLNAMGAQSSYIMVTADVERSTRLRATDLKITELAATENIDDPKPPAVLKMSNCQ